MPKLNIKQGTTQQEFIIKDDVTSIGRSQDNIIPLNDIKASRRHCQIVKTPDGNYKIIDQGSANGTAVNWQKIKERVLQNGDIIKVGDVEMIFISAEVTSGLPKFIPPGQPPSTASPPPLTEQKTTVLIRPASPSGGPVGRGRDLLPEIEEPPPPPAPVATTRPARVLPRPSSAVTPKRSTTRVSSFSKLGNLKGKPLTTSFRRKPAKGDDSGEPQPSLQKPRSQMLIIGSIGAVILGGIILLIIVLSGGKPADSNSGSKSEVTKLYKEIQETVTQKRFREARDLCDKFLEKFRKSRYRSEITDLKKRLEANVQREANALKEWGQLKAEAEAAKVAEAKGMIKKVNDFISKYSGTAQAQEAEGIRETLRKLAAMDNSAIQEFNGLRAQIDRNFVDRKKYDEAIKEYEKIKPTYADDPIITDIINTEIKMLEQKKKGNK